MIFFLLRKTLRVQMYCCELLCAAASFDAYAQTAALDEATLPSVVIVGSRFSEAVDALAPIGATVITAEEIRHAGIENANQAVRKLAGVYGRQNAYGTQDFDLDMSGFGSDSMNNLVVMVDGVRISENEQAVAALSSIPIDSIARIEILRGGGSVLYGDGATSGVIQVITKQLGPTPLTGSATTELGQFHDRAARAYLAQGSERFNASLNVSEQRSDNYRANNASTQKNASGGLTWYADNLRAGLRVEIARQASRFPGALDTLAQFEQDPRQSLHPDDHGTLDIDRYTAFVEKNIGAWQAASELSTRERTVQSEFSQSQATYHGRQTGLTPRLRRINQLGGWQHEVVMGVDMLHWNRQSDSSYSKAYATQESQAVYVRNQIKADAVRFAFGARHELFDQTSHDPALGSTDNYSVKQGVNAWELQAGYAFSHLLDGYVKVGQSYRVANVDDNAYTATPNTPLLPQLSHDLEVGASWGWAYRQLIVRFFQHDITHEIYFDPSANGGFGANANLDPTERQGVALEAKWRLSQQLKLTAQAQHVAATFTAGPNMGKELALVPKNTLTTLLNWVIGAGRNAYLGGQWVDAQRYGGDFDNTCANLIPAHATVDARYAQTSGPWEWAVSGSNLTNRQYFSNAYGCMSGIYPDDGRQIKLSLRYGF
jgi:iron complex outermembrane receptor protein